MCKLAQSLYNAVLSNNLCHVCENECLSIDGVTVESSLVSLFSFGPFIRVKEVAWQTGGCHSQYGGRAFKRTAPSTFHSCERYSFDY